MRVLKGYKFRVNPTEDQQSFFAKSFGGCRFVWNYVLNTKKDAYLFGGVNLNFSDTSNGLTLIKKLEGLEWLNEINSQSIQQELRKLDVAYSRFFKKIGGFPKFKSKQDKQSFLIPQHFLYQDGRLTIPKLKSKIKVVQHREFGQNFVIKSVTISKNKAGQYFCSFLVEEDKIVKSSISNNSVGIDLGLIDLMTLSDGTKIKNPKIVKRYYKKLSYLHRQLSKKTKDSKSRERARLKLAKLYNKISQIKGDYTHKLTSKIISENQVIVMEDLSVANMMKNHKLARSIQDVSWYEIVRQLRYKADWNNRQFIQIDRFFPSSKTCNVDGYINQNMDLSTREWECPQCGTVHDRDVNAAINILNQGVNQLRNSGCGTHSESKQKLVEPSRKVLTFVKRNIEAKKLEAAML
jgi:putative transposase